MFDLCTDCRERELAIGEVRCAACQIVRELGSHEATQAQPGDFGFMPTTDAEARLHARRLGNKKSYGSGQV